MRAQATGDQQAPAARAHTPNTEQDKLGATQLGATHPHTLTTHTRPMGLGLCGNYGISGVAAGKKRHSERMVRLEGNSGFGPRIPPSGREE